MSASAAGTPPPHDGSLAVRIAARAKSRREDVEDVFTTRGLPLAYPPARPRSVRIHRLRVVGNRVGVQPEGPIDRTFTFNDGLTALVASNLKGKTSVLELVTWCLRGSPRAMLQADVRRWLTRLELDATIAGQPMGFRLSLTPDAMLSGIVLTAPDTGRLGSGDGVDGDGVSKVIETDNEDDFATQVAELMLDRLDLQPIVNKFTTADRVRTQTHGWPSYYSAIYLPFGRDRPLLGDQKMAGLAGRLLQVFLDLPATAVLARVKAMHDVLQSEIDRRSENTKRAVAERAGERARVEGALAEARKTLTQLQGTAPGPDLTDLANQAAGLARQVADAQDERDEINGAYRGARRARQVDEKALNDVRESEVARLLFHGLNPSACPRCEAPISGDRRQAERDVHRCAVCTSEVVTGAENENQAAEAEALERVAGSKAAEKASKEALGTAEAALERLAAELKTVQAKLRTAGSAKESRDRIAAEIEVARWEGALQVLPKLPDPSPDDQEVTLTVLKAASKVLDEESKDAASQLFADLNAEIVDLAHQFGMTALENVEINRAAQLKVIKGGGAEKSFGDQSPSEQLRLRVAVIMALLRVGARHGISTHPGLVLIDSPKAEELQDSDATVIFQELHRLATFEGLQVLITTADFHLAATTLPAECVTAVKQGDPLW